MSLLFDEIITVGRETTTNSWRGWDDAYDTPQSAITGNTLTRGGVDITLARIDWHASNRRARVWTETAAQLNALAGAWLLLAWPEADMDLTKAIVDGPSTRSNINDFYPAGTTTPADGQKVRVQIWESNPRAKLPGPYWVM